MTAKCVSQPAFNFFQDGKVCTKNCVSSWIKALKSTKTPTEEDMMCNNYDVVRNIGDYKDYEQNRSVLKEEMYKTIMKDDEV